MRHPCKRDCPERSEVCHTICERWAVYEAAKAERYARRDQEREIEQATAEAIHRMERKKRNHK